MKLALQSRFEFARNNAEYHVSLTRQCFKLQATLRRQNLGTPPTAIPLPTNFFGNAPWVLFRSIERPDDIIGLVWVKLRELDQISEIRTAFVVHLE